MKSRIFALITALIIIGTTGCADDRKPYVEPALAPAQVATLTGTWNVQIDEIDGRRVSNSLINLPLMPGNTVHVAPGSHDLLVFIEQGSGAAPPQPGITIHIGDPRPEIPHTFSFHFDPGHTYLFENTSFWSPSEITVTDKTLHKSLQIPADPLGDG